MPVDAAVGIASAERLLVVGCGSDLASDDAVGLVLAATLRRASRNVDVEDAGRPGVGLIDLLAGRRAVVFLDAVCSGHSPGSVVLCRLPNARVRPRALAAVSGHGWGIEEVLTLAAALRRPLPEAIALIGVEVDDVRPGIGLSLASAAAVGFIERQFDELAARALNLSGDDVVAIRVR